MAPNKRADNKRKLGLWLNVDLYEKFTEASEFFGSNMTALLTDFITEKVKEYEAITRRHAASRASKESTEKAMANN